MLITDMNRERASMPGPVLGQRRAPTLKSDCLVSTLCQSINLLVPQILHQ